MVRYKTTLNDDAMNRLVEISLKMESNVRRRKCTTVLIIILGLVVTCIGAVACLGKITGADAAMLILGIFITVFGLNQKSFQRATIKKNAKHMDPIFRSENVEYVFDSEGICIHSHLGNGMYRWDSFREYGTLDESLYIIRRDDKVIIVNQNELSKDDLHELRQLLEQNLPVKE